MIDKHLKIHPASSSWRLNCIVIFDHTGSPGTVDTSAGALFHTFEKITEDEEDAGVTGELSFPQFGDSLF